MNAKPSEETTTSTRSIPLRCSSESRYSTLELMRITRGSEIVLRRQSKNRSLISKTSNVAENGRRSSSKLVIAPVPAPNSTATRVRASGSGSSMAFAKYLELGEIAPTVGKLASASPINILRLMGEICETLLRSTGIASCSSSSDCRALSQPCGRSGHRRSSVLAAPTAFGDSSVNSYIRMGRAGISTNGLISYRRSNNEPCRRQFEVTLAMDSSGVYWKPIWNILDCATATTRSCAAPLRAL